MTQEELVEKQRSLVAGERAIFAALASEPSAELIAYLVERARLASAKRLSSQTSYMFRLLSRPVPAEEITKASRFQERLLGEQSQTLTALGFQP
jgi:hypothetical protein